MDLTPLIREIGSLPQPVITSYHLALILYRTYRSGLEKGEKLGKGDVPTRGNLNRHVDKLNKLGIVRPSEAVKHSGIFAIIGKDQNDPQEIACCIDPFCHISHMSAMEWHGLTSRVPKMIFISSPAPADWQKLARDRMSKDLGNDGKIVFRLGGLPTLQQLKVATIARKHVYRHVGRHLGAFTSVRDRTLRVSTIGRTFLDMIQAPDLCGGIYHVLEVWKEHAAAYIPLITGEIDQHGSKIDKVRAGYILEERLGLQNPVLEKWVAFAQRGGSRKLYANASYSERFSERWCLSLNIEESIEPD